ncbi:MAG: tetratricopeptide repeat protein [Lachnospiraceae bacterium]|nr:tetratricopeptide repeat protein [Lachnospiraceae bacterium]
MGNDTQNNEEQLEMLLMTLEDVKHGICLFQSRNQAKWVSHIQERLGKEKVIVHNIANDDEKNGMVSSQDFRRWACESDAKVVIVYNMQLLGLRFGDEEVVEKLNFMRDQILAIGKLFVFGVSAYFDLLLSRKARDLYSCILYHFILNDSEERIVGIRGFDWNELSSDDILETARYKEMKERIQNSKEKGDISTYLTCMNSWNVIRECISYQEKEFVTFIAEEVDKQYKQKEIELADVENIWILAQTWLQLEKRENSIIWYEKVLDIVRDKLGEEHEIYADALVACANYYERIGDYAICEKYYDQAIKIYNEKNMKYSEMGRQALQRKAIIYRRKAKFGEALNIYRDILDYQINKYGDNYYGNASIYNDMGTVHEERGELTRALVHYEKALELLDSAGKKGGWMIHIYQNICMIYLKNGDGNTAWKYIRNAKKITEDVYGKNSIQLINIYNSMSGVWSVRERSDKEFEYLQKALELIKETNMENSEIAAYVYHNMGRMLCLSGAVEDAILYCRYAINILKKVYGEKNELTASSYEVLAHALYQISNYIEAKNNIDKARNIYVSLYGKQNEHVKRIDEYILRIIGQLNN